MAESIGIGLIGLGTIGTGVAKVLAGNASVIEQRLGFPLRLVRVADLDLETDRGVDLAGIRFDADAEGLIGDPAVDIVVELIGGYDVARRLILRSIEEGKHVVTANKALLALHGAEIFDTASRRGVDVGFEASVAGGIPILRCIREGLVANRIESLHGIMNGTTNYVLTEMEKTGEDFPVVVKRAQDLGYAEADPTFDVEGVDAAHKLALLAAMSFGVRSDFKRIPTEGIRGLEPLDFEAADDFGYRIKLLAIAKSRGDGHPIEARVHPTLIPKTSMLSNVDGAMNAVAIRGDAARRSREPSGVPPSIRRSGALARNQAAGVRGHLSVALGQRVLKRISCAGRAVPLDAHSGGSRTSSSGSASLLVVPAENVDAALQLAEQPVDAPQGVGIHRSVRNLAQLFEEALFRSPEPRHLKQVVGRGASFL